jgi:hypothetical protein
MEIKFQLLATEEITRNITVNAGYFAVLAKVFHIFMILVD